MLRGGRAVGHAGSESDIDFRDLWDSGFGLNVEALRKGPSMELTSREVWAVIHGLVLGVIYLLAFAGALAGLWSLRPGYLTTAGISERMGRLKVGLGVMAAAAWGTVITGTYIVYPWYRAKLAGAEFEKCQDLVRPTQECSPRDFLLANVNGETAAWHEFGMEWKEHVAWATPFLATSAFLLVVYYGPRLVARPWLRNIVLVMIVAAFAAAVVAGAFGAFINKVAPII